MLKEIKKEKEKGKGKERERDRGRKVPRIVSYKMGPVLPSDLCGLQNLQFVTEISLPPIYLLDFANG